MDNMKDFYSDDMNIEEDIDFQELVDNMDVGDGVFIEVDNGNFTVEDASLEVVSVSSGRVMIHDRDTDAIWFTTEEAIKESYRSKKPIMGIGVIGDVKIKGLTIIDDILIIMVR